MSEIPVVPGSERSFSAEEITELAIELQNEINDCPTDYEVSEALTRWISKYGPETVTKSLAENCAVLDEGARGYYLKVIDSLVAQQKQRREAINSETEPSFEDLEAIKGVTEKFTEETISEVLGFCSEVEHRDHPSRVALREAVGSVFQIAHTMVSSTALFSDRKEKALYPNFWSVLDKFDRMMKAVGAIRDDGRGEIHHERTLYTQ